MLARLKAAFYQHMLPATARRLLVELLWHTTSEEQRTVNLGSAAAPLCFVELTQAQRRTTVIEAGFSGCGPSKHFDKGNPACKFFHDQLGNAKIIRTVQSAKSASLTPCQLDLVIQRRP